MPSTQGTAGLLPPNGAQFPKHVKYGRHQYASVECGNNFVGCIPTFFRMLFSCTITNANLHIAVPCQITSKPTSQVLCSVHLPSFPMGVRPSPNGSTLLTFQLYVFVLLLPSAWHLTYGALQGISHSRRMSSSLPTLFCNLLCSAGTSLRSVCIARQCFPIGDMSILFFFLRSIYHGGPLLHCFVRRDCPAIAGQCCPLGPTP